MTRRSSLFGDTRGLIYVEYLIVMFALYLPTAVAFVTIGPVVVKHHFQMMNVLLYESP